MAEQNQNMSGDPTALPPSRARAIFAAAREHTAGPDRDAYLADACGSDAALRNDVASLIALAETESGFMSQPASPPRISGAEENSPALEMPGDLIGPYKLLQVLGEGGCGIVYVAEQEKPVRRQVALKIIKAGMDTRAVIARFEAERQALALMDHRHIAKVLDAGATNTGRPYFAMELVPGQRITDYCDQHRLSIPARLELFVKVCQAVQHAHQKGIIHRDLKPSNILVTSPADSREEPCPKVIDFGIAKAAGPAAGVLTDKTLVTHLHQVIGTPAYMSPEQAVLGASGSGDVDTRSDIYSLGVLLYELITGRTPFDVQKLLANGYEAMRRTLQDREPEPPSTRLHALPPGELESIARCRWVDDTSRLVHRVRGDLDWIVMKALEKDPARRYQTAVALADDVIRHVSNEPVVARPPSAAYRFRKLVCRNRLVFASGAAVVVALMLGLCAASWQAIEATRARRIAEAARAAEAQERAQAVAERNRAQAATARAETEAQAARRNAYAAAMLVARADWDNGNIAHLRQVLNETTGYPEKSFEWYFWQRQCHLDLLTFWEHHHAVSAACFSPDGSRIASASTDATVLVWDASDGHIIATLLGHSKPVRSVTFSSDGRRLMTSGGDGTVRAWEVESGAKSIRVFPGREGAFIPDSDQVLLAGLDGRMTVRDLDTGRERADLGIGEGVIKKLFTTPTGVTLVSENAAGEIQGWRFEKPGQLIPIWHHRLSIQNLMNQSVVLSPNGRLLAGGGLGRLAKIWDTDSGQETGILMGHGDDLQALAFSPDGRRVASASRDRTVRIWDAETGAELRILKGHLDTVRTAAFSPDGHRLVTAGDDRTAKVWDTTDATSPRYGQPMLPGCPDVIPPAAGTGANTNGIQMARFSPDERLILTAGKDAAVRIWDAATLKELRVLCGHTESLSHANFSPDGRRISSGGDDRTLSVWELETGKRIRVWQDFQGVVYWSKLSRDGERVLSACSDGFARIHDVTNGALVLQWMADSGGVWAAEFFPDERRVATAGSDGVVKIWDATSGEQLMAWPGHRRLVIPLAFSADGTRIVTGGQDRTIRVWDAADGRELLRIAGHGDAVWDVNFSPDGRRLVSAAFDKSVRIWDAANGREMLMLRGKSDYHMAASFSPNGRRVASGGNHPTFEVWESADDAVVARWNEQEEAAERRRTEKGQKATADPRTSTLGRAAITSWLILAPIPLAANRSFSQQIRDQHVPDESRLRPRTGDAIRIGGMDLSFKSMQFGNGLIDFNRAIGRTVSPFTGAYAVCYARSPVTRTDLRVTIASDDQSRVYLNGRCIYESAFTPSLNLEPETVGGIILDAGLNTIVLKAINWHGHWRSSMSFTDQHGQPVEDIQFTLSPD